MSTKTDKISQWMLILLSTRQINWEILSNFCGLLRKPEECYFKCDFKRLSHFSQTRIKLKRTLSYFRNDNLFNFVIVLCGVDQWLIWPSAWNNYWFLSGGKSTNKYLLHCAVKCFQFCNWNQDLQKSFTLKYFLSS